MYEVKFFKDEKLPFIESRYVKDSPNTYSEHFHGTLSIGAVENGVTLYKCDGLDYKLVPNALAVINPDVLHSCNPEHKGSRSYHMLYIDKDWCKGLQASLFDDIDRFMPLDKVQIEDEKFYKEFIALNKSLLDEKIFYLNKEELLIEFMIKLFKSYGSFSIKNDEVSKGMEYIQKIKEYIDKNLNENITIEEISEFVSLSKFYIIKIFKKYTNITPYIYLLNKKIHRAKELLSQNIDIVDVALELGFYDQSHLNRVFKQYVAVTPKEYKDSLLKK